MEKALLPVMESEVECLGLAAVWWLQQGCARHDSER
jgi:hypothetical protein